MKKRLVLWGLLVSIASIATAASFGMPATHAHYDPNARAKELGISPSEYKKVRHAMGQFSSDVRHRRDINSDDLKLLTQAIEKGGPLAGEAYWNLVPIKVANYRTQFAPMAVKGASSKDDSEAYGAMALLKYWGDSRWRTLAMNHQWKAPMYKDFISEEW